VSDEPDYKEIWRTLSGGAKDTLVALCKHGPLWDGDVPSKCGRDELLRLGLASKIVLKNNEQGYQAANYKGSRVYRYGYLEPRKDIVRKLVGSANVSSR
jgi:hypothetical protein